MSTQPQAPERPNGDLDDDARMGAARSGNSRPAAPAGAQDGCGDTAESGGAEADGGIHPGAPSRS